jgi:methionine sulfoxide reductase heme-binding subunit
MKVKKRFSLTRYQVFAHMVGLFPLAWLVLDGLLDNLTVNPIQDLTQRTGRFALYLLLLSLACTPVHTIFKLNGVLKIRRTLGLYAFLYAAGHFILFTGVDYAFNFAQLAEVFLEKPYALVGLAAFTILSVLAITSVNWWKKKLGKTWKRLHRFVYLAGVLVIVHYFWVAKGDLLRLSGDIFKPLVLGGLLIVLLAVRLPWIKRLFSQRRGTGQKTRIDPPVHTPIAPE